MNQIVLIALRRPYTFVVLSILIVIFGIRAIRHSPTDVFPTIKIPVISVVWAYAGMLPPDMSPPMIMRLEASQVAVASLQITSDEMTPADLYNLSYNQLRPLIVVIPGAIVPHPYGGKPKQ